MQWNICNTGHLIQGIELNTPSHFEKVVEGILTTHLSEDMYALVVSKTRKRLRVFKYKQVIVYCVEEKYESIQLEVWCFD